MVLADGSCWSLQAKDDEAAVIVEQLSKAMNLRFGLGTGRKLCITVDDQSPECGKVPFNLSLDPVIAVLHSPQDRDFLTIQMYKISLIIARDVLTRCGLILHGALAEYKGMGVILAGPGNVGKSTASRRLPPPWKSLCDDACLVVRDEWGQYWAHPLPTWSLFYQNGAGGCWDVQRAVPLNAIFFLRRSPQDRIEELNESQELSMLMESTNQISRIITYKLLDDEVQSLHIEQMAASEVLATTVPAYMLHISLTGMFWKDLENELLAEISHTSISPVPAEKDSTITVVFTGTSMEPTLRDGYLLTVTPYMNKSIQKGDVIYFQRQGKRGVVHRVIQVTKEGVQTKGDNNSRTDPFLLEKNEILGQVITAQNGRKSWRVHGGMRGWAVMRRNQLASSIFRRIAKQISGPYRRMTDQNIFFGMLPPSIRPKVVSFKVSMYRDQFKLKLIAGSHEIGRYDYKNEKWQIRPLFRLFVDQSKLQRFAK
jgi:SynChlorMet cassette protein ScmC